MKLLYGVEKDYYANMVNKEADAKTAGAAVFARTAG